VFKVKKINLVILSFLSFAFLLGCGKKTDKVEIKEAVQASPISPFFVEEEEDDTIILNPSDLKKDDPCYKYLKNKIVAPVATCTELENGRIKDSYKSTIHGGKLCLLRKSFPSGMSLYTLVGVVSETVKGSPRRNIKVDIFGEGDTKDQDLLRFTMKGEVKSSVRYSLSEDSATVRTVSKLWKKRYRYYRFACKKINPIVD
jgi:hypothetical protein